MRATPNHAPMTQFPVLDNELQVGGLPLSRVAARVGQTPFYAYDRQLISDRVAALRSSLPDRLHLHYAIKANSMPAVVQHLSGLTDGLDVASLGEMKTALDTGISPDKISFAGPGKSDNELAAAVAAGVIVNVESEGELERIAACGEQQSLTPRISVRVNPDFELKTSGMKMSGGPKPFGIDAECVPDVLHRISELTIDFKGFHIFSGSQNLRPEALIEAHTKTFELAYRLAEAAPVPVTWLNIGGGFGIPYFPGDQSLDLRPVAENLQRLMDEGLSRLPEAQIVIELGRYLVGEAGIYVSQVIDKKVSRGETFVITNGGLHQHLAASGNFGQVIRKNYPVAVGNRMTSKNRELVNIVGPLCTPLDILANKVELPEIKHGDLIVIYQSGAYGLTASPQGFLSHPPTVEILV